jgi:hypothetical protein
VPGRHVHVSSDSREHRPRALQRDLLGPEAVEPACELIRGWVRSESVQITERESGA